MMPAQQSDAMKKMLTSVLFVCQGHSCRSVMAEALAKHLFGAQLIARSAGTSPNAVYDSKSAIKILKSKFGIDIPRHQQTNVRDLDLDTFTYVVAMDSAIAKSLAKLTRRSIVTWQVEDPWGGDAVVYHQCALTIRELLEQFATVIRPRNKTRKAASFDALMKESL
jgi:ArsR family transcriptional regulator